MGIGSFGGTELIIALVIILLLVGAKRIPELAKGLGSGVREFRKGSRGDYEVEEENKEEKNEELAAGVVAWFFVDEIFNVLLEPAGDALDGKLNFTSVTEALFSDVKLALYTAFLFTIPVLLYQAWAFVAPAVGDMGRAFTYVLISLASSLFLAGVAFGYFVVLPIGTSILLNWDTDRYNALITSGNYLSFVTRFLLAFGIVFEFPAATYVGAKLELVDAPF